jgi:hypothetical protein
MSSFVHATRRHAWAGMMPDASHVESKANRACWALRWLVRMTIQVRARMPASTAKDHAS